MAQDSIWSLIGKLMPQLTLSSKSTHRLSALAQAPSGTARGKRLSLYFMRES